MNKTTTPRVLLDIVLRSVALLVLVEGITAIYFAANPSDDGLGTGLTAMFVLVYAAAMWGLWDGFHRAPVQLLVSWAATGVLVGLGAVAYSLTRYDGWSWANLTSDLSGELLFWIGLVAVPAIVFGIVPSAVRHRADAVPLAHQGVEHHS